MKKRYDVKAYPQFRHMLVKSKQDVSIHDSEVDKLTKNDFFCLVNYDFILAPGFSKKVEKVIDKSERYIQLKKSSIEDGFSDIAGNQFEYERLFSEYQKADEVGKKILRMQLDRMNQVSMSEMWMFYEEDKK